jgi:hypothetical protein
MDQRSICLFLAMKRLSTQTISNELVAVLGRDAIGYSTVTKGEAYDPRPENHHYHCIESIAIFLDRGTS